MKKTIKVLVTGAQGFIGKNLIARLRSMPQIEVLEVDKTTSDIDFSQAVKEADFVYHLAAVNRPEKTEDFKIVNVGFTEKLLNFLAQFNQRAPIIFSSSIQAEKDNPYGKSKKESEDLLLEHQKVVGNKVYIYRLSNVFGKWSRPNYNSVVATFCDAIGKGLPITIHDPNAIINLVYIDDVVSEMIKAITNEIVTIDSILRVLPEYTITVGELATRIQTFKQSRHDLKVVNQLDPFMKKLYATYLSYLDQQSFSYDLTMHKDQRGSFTELLKLETEGQISVNITLPGITKGNHYHHTKNEKFIVVNGEAEIAFRQVGSSEIIRYQVSGDAIKVVDIPPGYVHSIKNIGSINLVTIMWASEQFDPLNPDTYPMEVVYE
jgi:UDP-2-acetamido-2,6-beta-L-arabino-hexul-4-ose reductase